MRYETLVFCEMKSQESNTLCKAERLNSKKSIELLFSGKATSFSAFPLRAVFYTVERGEGDAAVSIITSVSKRKFKQAVKRNRLKRLMRETYRVHKHRLIETVEAKADMRLLVCFIYLDDKLHLYPKIEKKMQQLLDKICDELGKE